jgi:hypothetical protein
MIYINNYSFSGLAQPHANIYFLNFIYTLREVDVKPSRSDYLVISKYEIKKNPKNKIRKKPK